MTQKLTFLITAGPTQESIDPVRYLTNHSSGKMGYALAEAALKKGHHVLLVTGPTALIPPKKAQVFPVTTALEMHKIVLKHFRKADVIIKAAAVADYRSLEKSNLKIKKNKKTMTLKLIKNPDILSELGEKKRKDQILVGFAAETNDVLAHALKKLRSKKCDWLVVNDVSKKGIGFNADNNEVFLLSQSGEKIFFAKMSKKKIAQALISSILIKK